MDAKTEVFQARISIKTIDDQRLHYIYDREYFDEILNVERQDYDNSQFIEVGQILAIENIKYKVVSINFKFEDHLHEMNSGAVTKHRQSSDHSNFNCQIGVFVEKIL